MAIGHVRTSSSERTVERNGYAAGRPQPAFLGHTRAARDRPLGLALRYGPGTWPGVVAEKLMNETVFPVASPAYRNRDGIAPRAPADLVRATLLRHPAQPWEPWFQAARLDLTESARAPRFTDANALIDATLKGRGVALARRSLIEPELAAGTLVRVSTVRVTDVYAHYVVWRPDHPREAAIRTWLDWLRSEVRRRTPRR